MVRLTKSTVESAALRDALLPKLISGQMNVRCAQAIVKEAGV